MTSKTTPPFAIIEDDSTVKKRPSEQEPPVMSSMGPEEREKGAVPSTIGFFSTAAPEKTTAASASPSPLSESGMASPANRMESSGLAAKVKSLDRRKQDFGEEEDVETAPYTDYSNVPLEELRGPSAFFFAAASAREPPFPIKLHQILSNPEFHDIIGWLPHGRSWRVLKPKAFEDKVIPLHFRHCRYSSFMRQVNGWGFKRVFQGADLNSYYHELFLRGLPHLCLKMRRPSVKKTAKSQNDSINRAPAPDFYKISAKNPLPEYPEGSTHAAEPAMLRENPPNKPEPVDVGVRIPSPTVSSAGPTDADHNLLASLAARDRQDQLLDSASLVRNSGADMLANNRDNAPLLEQLSMLQQLRPNRMDPGLGGLSGVTSERDQLRLALLESQLRNQMLASQLSNSLGGGPNEQAPGPDLSMLLSQQMQEQDQSSLISQLLRQQQLGSLGLGGNMRSFF